MSFRIYIITMQSRLLCYSLPHNDSKGGSKREEEDECKCASKAAQTLSCRISHKHFRAFYSFPFMKKKDFRRKNISSQFYIYFSQSACGLLLYTNYYLFIRL